MTDPPQEPCGPQASPAGGVPAGPVMAALDEACWYGPPLINRGWIIRTVGASARGGYFVVETPHGRAVTVGPGHRRAVSDGAEEFADAITVLAATGAQHGHDYLRELMVLLAAHAAPPGQLGVADLGHPRAAGESAAHRAGAGGLLVRGHARRRLRLAVVRGG